MELLLPKVPHQLTKTGNFLVLVNAVLDQQGHVSSQPVAQRQASSGLCTSCPILHVL